MKHLIAITILLSLTGCGMIGGGEAQPQLLMDAEGNVHTVGRNQYDRDADVAESQSRLQIQLSKERQAEKNLIATTPTRQTITDDNGTVTVNENYSSLVLASRYKSPEAFIPYAPPESETAQIIRATGEAVTGVARTPLATAAGLGYVFGQFFGGIMDRPTVEGEYVTIKKSFNSEDNDTTVGGNGDPYVLNHKGDTQHMPEPEPEPEAQPAPLDHESYVERVPE
jgi:hypothetical protein